MSLNALIVADGDIPSRAALDRLLPPPGAALVIAADGGALKAAALGLRPNVVVGDADSLPERGVDELRGAGIEVIISPSAKDQSDTELAVREALGRGASALLIVGAFGGPRLEHTIANLLLLCLPELAGIDCRLADGATVVRLLHAGQTLTINGRADDFVSLLPLAPVVAGVTTSGLAYPLIEDSLVQGPARGLSNVMTADVATVTALVGRLLVVHTVAQQ
jgi:thiamine pyrophosphokinase